MCGRYYIDEETAREVKELAGELSEWWEPAGRRDVFPAQKAAVLCAKDGKIKEEQMLWGIPGPEKRLVINARAESALEKRMFRENLRKRRCMIPAGGFYEWNRQKEKAVFYRPDHRPLYLAGCYEPDKRFVILTTAANESVAEVHFRMPLILEKEEAWRWLACGEGTEEFLRRRPGRLEKEQEYQQLSLF